MGRELQKKKKRSSIPKVRMKPKSKRVNPLGNPIVAANWNQNETLTQNYRRLGLTSRLNTVTGGIEKRPSATSTSATLAISNTIPKTISPTEATVERDPSTGKITRIIHSKTSKPKTNPLNDPLNSDSDSSDSSTSQGFGKDEGRGEENEILRQLEDMASRGEARKPRKQSEREQEWIARLVQKHGEEGYGRMARDRRLNPMQQTEADIRRRVARWRAAHNGNGNAAAAPAPAAAAASAE